MTATEKLDELRSILRSMGSVALAYSGGTDSGLLLKVAKEELGDKVVAFTAVSASFPSYEREKARELAASIGAEMVELPTDEISLEEYARNDAKRCYHCKRLILQTIWSQSHARGLSMVVDGNNADDAKTSRPGLLAAKEMGTRSPLAEADLTKSEVRELARSFGLDNWDKPSSACLASRVPYGTRITGELLERIERAEDAVRTIGVTQLRVRAHDDIARIEVLPEEFAMLISDADGLVRELKELGFKYVALDLEGFRSGSLDD
ncbi:MAG: ATP-dependent sacrificial sulfur transferase LarE [Euryarchaeota archaeon]|nr:ATP-dependent sacrificial sulfur transferase LarE [Euryarchaeota archaeon]